MTVIEKRDVALNGIAQTVLKISTLERRNMDSLDFHSLAVWVIKHALVQAYAVGFDDALARSGEFGPPVKMPMSFDEDIETNRIILHDQGMNRIGEIYGNEPGQVETARFIVSAVNIVSQHDHSKTGTPSE